MDKKRRFAILSVTALVSALGAAASGCGLPEGQEKIEKARQVEKSVEDSQRGMEKKLQEGQETLEVGR